MHMCIIGKFALLLFAPSSLRTKVRRASLASLLLGWVVRWSAAAAAWKATSLAIVDDVPSSAVTFFPYVLCCNSCNAAASSCTDSAERLLHTALPAIVHDSLARGTLAAK